MEGEKKVVVRGERCFPCVSEHVYYDAVILGEFFCFLLQQSGGWEAFDICKPPTRMYKCVLASLKSCERFSLSLPCVSHSALLRVCEVCFFIGIVVFGITIWVACIAHRIMYF